MSDDIIKRALGMGIYETIDDKKALIPYEGQIEPADDAVEMDFEYVRDNLKDLIAQGQEAISELMVIAKQSQHPRAFEVIATLLKATADMNNDVMMAHKRKGEMRPSSANHSKGVASVTNNNLFVGSTADLQNFLEQQKKNNE